jgi:hypothetical protein
MNKKLNLLGIVLLIVMTLTSCFYYHGHGYSQRDYDRHWQGDDRSHFDRGDYGGDRRPR